MRLIFIKDIIYRISLCDAFVGKSLQETSCLQIYHSVLGEIKLHFKSAFQCDEWLRQFLPLTETCLPDIYEELEQIGAGASGKVFKAINLETGNQVALKHIADSERNCE